MKERVDGEDQAGSVRNLDGWEVDQKSSAFTSHPCYAGWKGGPLPWLEAPTNNAAQVRDQWQSVAVLQISLRTYAWLRHRTVSSLP
jgi:hypothetical protein